MQTTTSPDRIETSDRWLALLNGNRAAAGVYDELCEAGGVRRGHWGSLARVLEQLGPAELAARGEDCRRLLAEHGVTCPTTVASEWKEQPWELDLVPFVLSEVEWASIEAAMVQRARLLNEILRDLYSSQRLVRDGFLPAPLVYANPAYLRACQALEVPEGQYLQLYAADLVRCPKGRWRVLGDRTQVPTGLGFALENRAILSRVLPEALHAVQPRSLAQFVRLLREAVSRHAPAPSDNPTIAVFTPGARNEAYFEHAYLARHLGFTLVEGGDLTVRAGRVCIKTIEGLRPVDVLLRRTRDFMSDPLELRGDSLLGVPGLVEAVRSGNVAIVNALGSGVVEGPAFLPFLPSLCRHVLGEDLRFESAPTSWCGQLKEFQEMRMRVPDLAIRPAFVAGLPPDRPLALSPDRSREELFGQIDGRCHEFVGQDPIHPSVSPVWNGHHLEFRPVALRVFVVAVGAGYHAIPGGLARVLPAGEPAPAILPLTGTSKDVWVLHDAREDRTGIITAPAPVPLVEHLTSDLPSRAAESFFWLGRYTERLEQRLRIVRCGVGRLMDEPAGQPSLRLAAFAALLAECRLVPVAASVSGPLFQRELLRLLYEIGRNGGVRPLLDDIHKAAFTVRDRLSADTWRILNRLAEDARPRPGRLPLVHAQQVLNGLILDLSALSGMETENMTRGFGWRFLDLGRRIERAISLCQLLNALLRCPGGCGAVLDPVLEIADSTMTYRRRHFSEPQLPGVLDLLVHEPSNPRSIAFQLIALTEHSAHLPDAPNPAGTVEIRSRVADVATRPAAALGWEGPAQPDSEVSAAYGDRLLTLVADLAAISDLLTHVYHSHVLPRLSQ